MKRLLYLLLATALLMSAIVGCAAQSNNDTGGTWPMSTTTAASGGEDNGSSIKGNPSAERKIVRDATLDLEVKDVLAAYDELLAFAVQNGGYEVMRTQQRSGGYITVDAQIKIKPEMLDAFIEFAGTQGEILNTVITTEDITEQYYDAQTRLKTMESSLETYYGFLEEARTIDESLSVQYQINQLTAEIESLKGKIKLWDSLLAESTITLRLRQVDDPVKLKKEINWSTLSLDDMSYLMKSGLTGLLNIVANVLQWLAIALVVTSPLWIIGLILLIVLLRRSKKRRLKQQRPPVPTTPAATESPARPKENQ